MVIGMVSHHCGSNRRHNFKATFPRFPRPHALSSSLSSVASSLTFVLYVYNWRTGLNFVRGVTSMVFYSQPTLNRLHCTKFVYNHNLEAWTDKNGISFRDERRHLPIVLNYYNTGIIVSNRPLLQSSYKY